MRFASDRHTVGICDRCDEKFPKRKLRREEVTNLLVCDGCYDHKHPQMEPTKKRLDDPRPVKDPRPREPAELPDPSQDLMVLIPPTTGRTS